jgi:hypothetical protein
MGVYGRGGGVERGLGVGEGLGVKVGVAVGVGVGVGLGEVAQYLPPVIGKVLASPPPHTIISPPVQTAVG